MFNTNPSTDFRMWNYIQGTYDNSIVKMRLQHFMNLAHIDQELKIALRNPETNTWTKWQKYYGAKLDLQLAYDIHRSLLPFEIVIESDYDDYSKNYEAANLYGKLLEAKGWKPSYYFSGSRSIHVHCFLDRRCFLKVSDELMNIISTHYKRSLTKFLKDFTEYIRTQIITCYGTGMRQFDTQLSKDTHLIRAELSRNKLGFKTFLGYHYNDLTPFPIICNEDNGKYPQIGEVRESIPTDIEFLLKDFIRTKQLKAKKKKEKDRENGLLQFFGAVIKSNAEISKYIKYIESDKFTARNDGYNRATFILINYYKGTGLTNEQVLDKISVWNNVNGANLSDYEINYMIYKQQPYTITEAYIISFLQSLDVDINTIET